MALPNFLNLATQPGKKKKTDFQEPAFRALAPAKPVKPSEDLQPPPSISPRLDGMLSPTLPQLGGALPKPPGVGNLPPSPGLGTNLPPRLGGDLTGALPGKQPLGEMQPLPQPKPLAKQEVKPKAPSVTSPLAGVFGPDKKLTEMQSPVTITTAGLTKPFQAEGPPTTTAGQAGEYGSSGASRFINFDRLLSANVPGATGMAQEALGEAFTRGKKAEEGVKGLSEKFAADVQKGTNIYGGETIVSPSEDFSTPGVKRQGLEGVPQTNGGTGIGISPEEAQRRAEQGYTGPSMDDFTRGTTYEEAQKGVQKAAEAQKAMTSQAGLEALLNEMYGTSGGTGGSRLDAALARVAGGGAFGKTAERFKGLDTLLESAARGAQQQVQSGKDLSNEAQALYADALRKKADEDAYLNEVKKQRDIAKQAADIRARDEQAAAERGTRWAEERVPLEDRVATISEENQAAMMGMTLEEWIAAGRPWGK